MNPERWDQVKHLFESALTLESTERETFISRYAGGDEELRQEVLSLLDSHDATGDFLEQPALSVQQFAEQTAPVELSLIGERVGAWQLIEEIGRGGMGTVYLRSGPTTSSANELQSSSFAAAWKPSLRSAGSAMSAKSWRTWSTRTLRG